MRYQPDRARAWRAWLVTTAEREVWRLSAIEAGQLPLEVEDGVGPLGREPADQRDHVAIRERLREALHALSLVPERRRAVKALHVTGFSYDEIAERMGVTYTRVNRLMHEANAAIGEEKGRPSPRSSWTARRVPYGSSGWSTSRRGGWWRRSAIDRRSRPSRAHC